MGGVIHNGDEKPPEGGAQPQRRGHQREMAGVMRMLDKNGDGQVDHDEYMKPVYRSVGAHDWQGDVIKAANTMEWWESMYRKADLDGDGQLSPLEMRYCTEMAREAVAASMDASKKNVLRDYVGALSVRKLFESIDTDGDGWIDPQEYAAAMEKSVQSWGWGRVDAEVAKWRDEIFDKCDVNGDGALDPDEFQFSTYLVRDDLKSGMWSEKRFISAMFMGLDKDGDKMISLAELNEAIDKDRKQIPKTGKMDRVSVLEIIRDNFYGSDRNKDGGLDEEEVVDLSRKIVHLVEGAEAMGAMGI